MRRNDIQFSYAIRSYVGYLEGTKKAAHTIKNYQLDIFAFQDFIVQENSGKILKLDQVSRSDVERYREFLKEKGFKTNTRRRKLLTVTQFLNYLAKRKKIAPEMAQKLVAPHKIERIPFTVSSPLLIQAIRALPDSSFLDARNRALLWTLAETGCQVSEVSRLRFEDWILDSPLKSHVFIPGKSSRNIPVTLELYDEIHRLQERSKDVSWIFLGFNKFGSLGSPMSPRGVELLVKHYGPKIGFPDLTPRTFRHSIILRWFEIGVPQAEIQARLGLKTTYAFRSYIPLLKSSEETTSTFETNQPES